MPKFVGFEKSTFDADKYRLETTDPHYCPHCGMNSHTIVSRTGTPGGLIYDEEALRAAIENDTLDFGFESSGRGGNVRIIGKAGSIELFPIGDDLIGQAKWIMEGLCG